MAVTLSNRPFASPLRSLVASPQPLPFSFLSFLAPASIRTLAITRRSKALMGSSSSAIHIDSSSSSSTNPYTTGFDNSVMDALANVQVFSTSTGNPVLLKDLWDQKEGIAVVSLLRHFGCICCWELASELKELIPRFESAGVKLICIGVGTTDNARILAEGLPFPLDYLYADPDRKAYDVLGLYYGFGRTFLNPASIKVFSRFSSLRKLQRTIQYQPHQQIRAVFCSRVGCLYSKGKN